MKKEEENISDEKRKSKKNSPPYHILTRWNRLVSVEACHYVINLHKFILFIYLFVLQNLKDQCVTFFSGNEQKTNNKQNLIVSVTLNERIIHKQLQIYKTFSLFFSFCHKMRFVPINTSPCLAVKHPGESWV